VPVNPVSNLQVVLDRAMSITQAGNNSVIHVMPMTVPFGSVQPESPPLARWVQLSNGMYESLTLSFTDGLGYPVPFIDNNAVAALIFEDRKGR
jgi:hypothetical protein